MTAREQPVRTATGLKYGQKKQLEDAQQAVPLPDNTPAPATGQGQAQPVQRPNVFAPTERPGEPLTAGAAAGAGPSQLELLPPDPVAHLRALYQRFPHEDLRRLLERASESGATRNVPQPPTTTSRPTGPQTRQTPNRPPAPATPTPPAPPTETGL